jgi:opacity protein-like surface antigen
MSKRMLGAIIVCLSLFTAPVYADSEDEVSEYARNGVYFMAVGVFAIENFGSWDLKDSYGVGARLGYRLHPYLAAEAQYEWLGGFDCKAHARCYVAGGPSGSGVKVREYDGHVATVNAKAFLLTGRVQPYALVGVGGGRFEVKKKERRLLPDGETVEKWNFSSYGNGLVSRFGVGVDLYGDEAWAMFTEAAYVLPRGNLRDLDYVSIEWGFLWRF